MTNIEAPRESTDGGRVVQSDLDIGTLIQILRQRRGVIVRWTAVMTVLGILYYLATPKMYEARTVVQVEQMERPVVSTTDIVPEAYDTPEILKTFEQNLDSGALLLRVAKINHLDQDPRGLAEGSKLFRPLQDWIEHTFQKPGAGPPLDAKLIRQMEKRTMVKLRRGTRLIDVSVRAEDPTLAVQLSQSLVDEYIQLDLAQRLQSAKPAYEYLLGEADRLKEKLQKSEQALQAYKEEQHAVSLEDTQNIVVETLKSLNASLSDARATRMKLEADYSRLQACEGHPLELISVPGIAASPDVQALKQRISEMEGIVASLGQRYTSTSPKYLQAQSELQKLNLSLDKTFRDAAGVIKSSYVSAKDTEDKLFAALQDQEKHALELNRIAIQYNVLSREVESDDALYEAVLKQLKEAQIIQGIEHGNIRVVEPATIPEKPVWPKKSIVLAVSLLLGMTLGSVAAVGPVLYKSALTGVASAEGQLGAPVLGAIPVGRARRGSHRIFLIEEPHSKVAEAFRSLLAVLLSPARKANSKTILFTSAVTGEGKSFCALNTAAAFANDGRRTLLIEADLRAPSIGSQIFGGKPLAGVVDILSGRSQLRDSIQRSHVENLDVLTAGTATEKPSELLGSNRMAELVREAASAYEQIVVDSAAILEAGDTLRIAGYADTICLVARSGETPAQTVARAMQLLAAAETNRSMALILNRVAGDFA